MSRPHLPNTEEVPRLPSYIQFWPSAPSPPTARPSYTSSSTQTDTIPPSVPTPTSTAKPPANTAIAHDTCRWLKCKPPYKYYRRVSGPLRSQTRLLNLLADVVDEAGQNERERFKATKQDLKTEDWPKEDRQEKSQSDAAAKVLRNNEGVVLLVVKKVEGVLGVE